MEKVLLILIIIYLYNYWQCSFFYRKRIEVKSEKIKSKVKIAHLTDYHCNKKIDLEKLERKLKSFSPDYIFITGDIVNRGTTDFTTTENFLKSLRRVTKDIYFVTGNHEFENNNLDELYEILEKNKIHHFKAKKWINIHKKNILLVGMDYGEEKTLENINDEKSYYKIYICHSFNRIKPMMSKENPDLVLSGHTHGGQVRLPIIGQILGHNFEILPKFSKGVYKINSTTLNIDSGLGNSSLNIRSFNRVQYSEIVIYNNNEI